MLTAIGLMIGLFTTYHAGREATKLEIEYRCEEYQEAPLASKYIECRTKEDLPWAKELREKLRKREGTLRRP